MAWIAPYSSTPSNAKMLATLNGVNLFAKGDFYVQYGGFAEYASSTTETSIPFAQASATANLLTKPASGTVQMSDDPSYSKYGPGSNLLLPGTKGQILLGGGQGAFTIGTVIDGEFMGSLGITGTPYLVFKLVLRNPLTGAVAYTLATGNLLTTVAGAVIVRPKIVVSAVGTSGTIVGIIEAIGGGTTAAVGAASVSAITSTTVDTTQNYILDLTQTWSASSASNTTTFYYGRFGLVG